MSSSKRHSLPAGPRPLQLVNGPLSDGLPSAPPSAYPLSPLTPTTPSGARRPSSITYNPGPRPARTAGHRTTLGRSNSVGGALDRPERDPVTLAEKHADLLHFIAQKESKCLELRSQLAMHEAELLQFAPRCSARSGGAARRDDDAHPGNIERVSCSGSTLASFFSSSLPTQNSNAPQVKRKWERIVSRGFTSPHNASASSSSFAASPSSGSSFGTDGNQSASPAPTSANGGAVLDGIREVGRFIAGFSPAPYSPAPSFASFTGSHSSAPSSSSMATSSTRLSQSSASSLDSSVLESPSLGDKERAGRGGKKDDSDEDEAQVLMVHDHGATPTMSPNPAFAVRRAARSRSREHDSSAEAEADFFFANAQARSSPALFSPPPKSSSSSSSSFATQKAPDANGRGARGLRPLSGSRPQSTIAIPGLALVDSVAPVSAWVGTVGRKWEELQKQPGYAVFSSPLAHPLTRFRRFAKNTKRASLLFSDIAHALQVGPTSPSASAPSPAPSAPLSPAPSASAVSLLDDDSDEGMGGGMGGGAGGMIPALTPALLPSPAAKPANGNGSAGLKSSGQNLKLPTRQQQQRSAPPAGLTLKPQRKTQQQAPQSPLSAHAPPQPRAAQAQEDDDDEEWNW
ncbi:hypothetical protein B0H15DRAFT_968599 [Mycena belliarum]|uniref:Uncharacterized protein n=1 Tax=Mycena belliarum TaxID=1033014 RepID=A0AAD6TLT2_9AGAR|nr:hypothetical protein B0H15DRAFT_968599 [Mycena belliae]